MTTLSRATTLLVAALLGAAAVAVAAPAAGATPADLQHATSSCWREVVNDWIQHQPNVLGTYPISCYTQAIQHLNSIPDVSAYSSAPDDIHRAQLLALRDQRGNGPGGGPSSGGSDPSSGGGVLPGGNGPSDGGGGSASGGGGGLLGIFGAHDATSIPLPLIVLGSLAILLALAALGTWLARRIQTRRPAPAPAVSRRR